MIGVCELLASVFMELILLLATPIHVKPLGDPQICRSSYPAASMTILRNFVYLARPKLSRPQSAFSIDDRHENCVEHARGVHVSSVFLRHRLLHLPTYPQPSICGFKVYLYNKLTILHSFRISS